MGAGDDVPTSAWQPVDGIEPELIDRLELDDIDLIADVTHPVRGRLLRQLKSPQTVAELAEHLDVPVTRLYHHVNRLEELGLIRVVATRRVAARTERRYQVVAKSLGLSSDLLRSSDPVEAAQALGSIFDLAKLDLQRSIESGKHGDADLIDRSVLSMGTIVLSPGRRAELHDRLDDLLREFTSDADDTPGAVRTTLVLAAFPSSD